MADYINAEYVDGQAGQTAGLYIFSRYIPTMTNADGPAGLRVSQSYTGLDGNSYYQYCTAYPVGTMIAQTWNTDLAYLMGTYVGREMNQYGVTEWLAPGMNIHRNPLCGRNFEYYSEDPLIAGMTGGYEALGLQSNVGVGVTHLSSIVCRELGIQAPRPDLTEWESLVERIRHQSRTVKIGLVGKYVQLHDAYLSVAEALRHAGYALDARINITWIDSETLTEENVNETLSPMDGLIVPGGFGGRGVEGMILTAQYAREHHVPYCPWGATSPSPH